MKKFPLFEKIKNRQKKYYLRKVAKEVKRVKWPTAKTNWTTFFQIIVFTILFSTFVFVVTLIFTAIWRAGGLNI
ncbi:preprotein translocase subunit SecE [Mycoplasmopsis synoviae]|uniref:Protein translocase subunit SecE n=2 Tax=Mycoplasmopsis synoviae TaxID=2109 RepID=Q4A649_MYCS5|nr:preprotein translocase subunit SecE [Mycoplasmopsis synoviae]AAZ43772.2 conserved hypothetical protein [Mycoplasmopsis synoviae 53]AKB11098.1 preprotein translocase subunit SecE [Mycoplasmopsis synoviae ATCC 25204]AKJ20582.1 Preprotein translocase subunit SecE [Mycoplasmopsis synoviae]AQU47902.1 Preprotein translocase subunit SecE [Mycoplasmopsis synoviae]AWL84149.1 preprotein translocase subunit SecE [Mycoplasmopsis synoviae]